MKTRRSIEEEISQKDIDELIDDMYRLLMSPGEEILHVIPQEYIIDNEVGIKIQLVWQVHVWKQTFILLLAK